MPQIVLSAKKRWKSAHDATNNKRQRIHENPPASLESLNGDCLLTILSYLPFDDLNSVAICSRRYQRARAHESLDQTRSGTIIISERCILQSLASKIMNNNWNQVFQGNRTHLKLCGLEWLLSYFSAPEIRRRAQLCGVSNLSLVGARATFPINDQPFNTDLFSLFPKLLELDMTSVAARDGYELCSSFLRNKSVTKLVWTNCHQVNGIDLNGYDFKDSSPNLHLHLDGCCFWTGDEWEFQKVSNPDDEDPYDCYAFGKSPHLQYLSMMNATCRVWDLDDEVHPVSQEMLIKMARRHPNLKWLRSDLSAENIAMLQNERPDVTFVSE